MINQTWEVYTNAYLFLVIKIKLSVMIIYSLYIKLNTKFYRWDSNYCIAFYFYILKV